ncbi:hypothetical protein BN381_150104 [Candidatus Microthrix parvicella RN1]|uniref:Uncharacterized protein n=1 Tax=Candidatus Neomicrothrix parvicella RN1 TaxID=1229780 RepID=R4Z125_9ACTN|nr:hypothetical protein BN381_150104 [Candidatus Microthrix parvicella RN1]
MPAETSKWEDVDERKQPLFPTCFERMNGTERHPNILTTPEHPHDRRSPL